MSEIVPMHLYSINDKKIINPKSIEAINCSDSTICIYYKDGVIESYDDVKNHCGFNNAFKVRNDIRSMMEMGVCINQTWVVNLEEIAYIKQKDQAFEFMNKNGKVYIINISSSLPASQIWESCIKTNKFFLIFKELNSITLQITNHAFCINKLGKISIDDTAIYILYPPNNIQLLSDFDDSNIAWQLYNKLIKLGVPSNLKSFS
jgi:hypothetical protein